MKVIVLQAYYNGFYIYYDTAASEGAASRLKYKGEVKVKLLLFGFFKHAFLLYRVSLIICSIRSLYLGSFTKDSLCGNCEIVKATQKLGFKKSRLYLVQTINSKSSTFHYIKQNAYEEAL